MKIALLQAGADPLNTERNLAHIDAAASDARAQGAELLLTPELFIIGYAPSRIRNEVSADRVRQAHRSAEDIARRHNIGLVYSLPGEEAPESRGITATFLGPSGLRLAHYQKVQLFGPEERAAFVPGDDPPPVVSFGGVRLGLMVCYDVEFPEVVRASAVAGVELLLVPTALADNEEGVPKYLIPARSLENRITIAYANHVGPQEDLDFHGGSLVTGPDGNQLGSLGDESGLLVVDVQPSEPPGDDGPWYLEDRRAELYRRWPLTGEGP